MRRSKKSYLRHTESTLTSTRQLSTILTLVFSLVLVGASAAQPSPLTISAKSGAARLVPHGGLGITKLPRYALYAEVQFERRLVTILNDVKSINGHIAISGAFYGGYWNDGISYNARIICRDCSGSLHSYRSYVAGMRVYANPSPIPLRFANPFMGLSYHFVHGNYLGSYDGDHVPGNFTRNDDQFNFGAFEAGLRLVIPVTNRLIVVGEAQRYLGHFLKPTTRREPGIRRVKERKSVTLGFSISL